MVLRSAELTRAGLPQQAQRFIPKSRSRARQCMFGKLQAKHSTLSVEHPTPTKPHCRVQVPDKTKQTTNTNHHRTYILKQNWQPYKCNGKCSNKPARQTTREALAIKTGESTLPSHGCAPALRHVTFKNITLHYKGIRFRYSTTPHITCHIPASRGITSHYTAWHQTTWRQLNRKREWACPWLSELVCVCLCLSVLVCGRPHLSVFSCVCLCFPVCRSVRTCHCLLSVVSDGLVCLCFGHRDGAVRPRWGLKSEQRPLKVCICRSSGKPSRKRH